MVLSLRGAGYLFAKALGGYSARNPWMYFWIGFAVVSVLVVFVSLFVPITIISLLVFFALGVTGLPFFYREYRRGKAQWGVKAEKILFGCIIILAFMYIASLSSYSKWLEWAYDTDLYHAQTIRWYNEYGTPPGLGNLHTRLAFNSSWLSLAALFDNGPWDNRGAWLMPALAVLGGSLYFLHELFFARRSGVRLYALCIAAWLMLGAWKVPGLYYDDPVHILLLLFWRYIIFFLNIPVSFPKRKYRMPPFS
jgi:hypothetical protein